jgi:hypothetical protein
VRVDKASVFLPEDITGDSSPVIFGYVSDIPEGFIAYEGDHDEWLEQLLKKHNMLFTE